MIYLWQDELLHTALPKPQAGNIYLTFVQKDNKPFPTLMRPAYGNIKIPSNVQRETLLQRQKSIIEN